MTYDEILDILRDTITDDCGEVPNGLHAATDRILSLYATEQMANACRVAAEVPEVKDRLEAIFGTRLVDALFGAPK